LHVKDTLAAAASEGLISPIELFDLYRLIAIDETNVKETNLVKEPTVVKLSPPQHLMTAIVVTMFNTNPNQVKRNKATWNEALVEALTDISDETKLDLANLATYHQLKRNQKSLSLLTKVAHPALT